MMACSGSGQYAPREHTQGRKIIGYCERCETMVEITRANIAKPHAPGISNELADALINVTSQNMERS